MFYELFILKHSVRSALSGTGNSFHDPPESKPAGSTVHQDIVDSGDAGSKGGQTGNTHDSDADSEWQPAALDLFEDFDTEDEELVVLAEDLGPESDKAVMRAKWKASQKANRKCKAELLRLVNEATDKDYYDEEDPVYAHDRLCAQMVEAAQIAQQEAIKLRQSALSRFPESEPVKEGSVYSESEARFRKARITAEWDELVHSLSAEVVCKGMDFIRLQFMDSPRYCIVAMDARKRAQAEREQREKDKARLLDWRSHESTRIDWYDRSALSIIRRRPSPDAPGRAEKIESQGTRGALFAARRFQKRMERLDSFFNAE